MTSLKVGGVPEHFNYPWYRTLKNKEYNQHHINLRWQDFLVEQDKCAKP